MVHAAHRTLQAITALSLILGTAHAQTCPPRNNLVAGGALRNTMKLTPTCGPLYQTFRNKFSTSRWTEMYLLDSARGTTQVKALLKGLQAHWYVKTRQKVSGQTQIYQFQKGKSTITVLVAHAGLIPYLALAGQ